MINTIKNAVAKRREDAEGNDKGFTLIELLVVVLIIGILAAIAIPAFLSQREGAWVSQVETALKNAALAGESYAVQHNGSYVNFDPEGTDEFNGGFNPTDEVTVEVLTATATEFELSATHTSLDGAYTYDTEGGKVVAPDEKD